MTSKRIAIMQPYFFPYIGYFQLLNLAETFVIYDDVNFIKGGWINRNRMLLNGSPEYFNAEMIGASSNKKINEVGLNPSLVWRKKLKKKIALAYSKAPYFNLAYPIVEDIIDYESQSLSLYVGNSLSVLSDYLGIETKIIPSSSNYANNHLYGYERVLDICKQEDTTSYVNPIGGEKLYSKEIFKSHGVELSFISTNSFTYNHFNGLAVPNLSILDVIMFNTSEQINKYLLDYTLS